MAPRATAKDKAEALPEGHVRITLAHPYATNAERYEATEAALQAHPPQPGEAPPRGEVEEHPPGSSVVVPKDEAQGLIAAGYAAIDAEDDEAVAEVLDPPE